MARLLAAFAFLTRFPVPGAERIGPAEIGRAVPCFAVVGLVLGLVVLAVLRISAFIGAPTLVACVLAVLVTVLSTGAFHQDALADAVDGLAGGRTPDDALRIMRESTIGAYGTVALIVALLARFVALTVLATAPDGWRFLVAAPALGRGCSALLGASRPYARTSGGLGRVLTDHVGIVERVATVGVVCGCAALLGGWALLGVPLAAVITARFSRYAERRVGGVTGDVLGATTELVEVSLLLLGAMVLA